MGLLALSGFASFLLNAVFDGLFISFLVAPVLSWFFVRPLSERVWELSAVRGSDVVARIGGDEFVLLFTGPAEAAGPIVEPIARADAAMYEAKAQRRQAGAPAYAAS